ncbi:hypothetical protein SE17_20245 [Kouleothrix aurantiaca]|uniref:Uncharacterized protein n=1 Tax=Kouleothrix aurantiaca TaxID=186479 RepID=A0A0P9CYR8_9CHLR|nr:hypothetical protein SE17_20245 [Kouleothrix aurantiaca]
MNRKLAIGLGGGALALALVGGAVYAGPTAHTNAAPVLAQATAAPNAPAAPAGQKARRAKAAGLAGSLIKATADATKTTKKDVLTALQGGQSLEQYAQSKGATSAAIISAARTAVSDRLKTAVTNGKLTQERADALLAQFDSVAPQMMANTSLGSQIKRGGTKGKLGREALIRATADATGTQPADVRAALKGGQSLAQYAQAHGKTADDIIARLKEQGETRLAKMLEKARELLDKPGLGHSGTPDATPQQ